MDVLLELVVVLVPPLIGEEYSQPVSARVWMEGTISGALTIFVRCESENFKRECEISGNLQIWCLADSYDMYHLRQSLLQERDYADWKLQSSIQTVGIEDQGRK